MNTQRDLVMQLAKPLDLDFVASELPRPIGPLLAQICSGARESLASATSGMAGRGQIECDYSDMMDRARRVRSLTATCWAIHDVVQGWIQVRLANPDTPLPYDAWQLRLYEMSFTATERAADCPEYKVALDQYVSLITKKLPLMREPDAAPNAVPA